MEELIQRYKMELQIMKYSINTVKNYCSTIKKYFSWCANGQIEISIVKVKQYIHHLFKKGLSSNTLSLHINALKSFFKIVLKTNILNEIRYPKRNKSIPHILERVEIIKILNVIENKKHQLFLLTS